MDLTIESRKGFKPPEFKEVNSISFDILDEDESSENSYLLFYSNSKANFQTYHLGVQILGIAFFNEFACFDCTDGVLVHFQPKTALISQRKKRYLPMILERFMTFSSPL